MTTSLLVTSAYPTHGDCNPMRYLVTAVVAIVLVAVLAIAASCYFNLPFVSARSCLFVGGILGSLLG